MVRNVLYIDDDPDMRFVEVLRDDLENAINVSEKLNTFTVEVSVEIPNDYMNVTAKELDLSGFFNHLDEKYLESSLDLVMCDFNMHKEHKHLAFEIIAHIRKRNKACGIILYSGSPLKELIRLNNNDLAKNIVDHINEENKECDVNLLEKKLEQIRKKETPAEELLQQAVTSTITEIVSRTNHDDVAVQNITKPSILLMIEQKLLAHRDCVLNVGDSELEGKTFGEIAAEIRKQSESGIRFTKYVLQFSLNNVIDLNW